MRLLLPPADPRKDYVNSLRKMDSSSLMFTSEMRG
jgi:hypothetical protein